MAFQLPIEPDIDVYRGPLEVVDDRGQSGTGEGRIALAFLPKPELVWSLAWRENDAAAALAFDAEDDLPQRVHAVRLTGGSVSRAMVLSIRHDGLGGVCREVAIGSASQPFDEIEFLLPNFGFSAIQRDATGGMYFDLETREYSIRIAQPSNYKEIIDHLRRTGGYAHTAKGTLRRRDGARIAPAELDRIVGPRGLLAKLGWFLSFANGGLTFPLEIAGVVESWRAYRFVDAPRITPWSSRAATWCSDRVPGQLDDYCKTFPRFRALLNDFPWNENVSLLIDWYLTVLEPAITEQRIISTQTALELFVWNRLVQDRASRIRISPEEYEDLERYPFKRKLRMILDEMRLDYRRPMWPEEKSDEPSRSLKIDAVDDFVDCRNHIIHPRPKSALRGTSDEDRFSVYLEGVRFLELAILWLLGYQGTIEDRRSVDGRLESPVPWTTSAGTLDYE